MKMEDYSAHVIVYYNCVENNQSRGRSMISLFNLKNSLSSLKTNDEIYLFFIKNHYYVLKDSLSKRDIHFLESVLKDFNMRPDLEVNNKYTKC